MSKSNTEKLISQLPKLTVFLLKELPFEYLCKNPVNISHVALPFNYCSWELPEIHSFLKFLFFPPPKATLQGYLIQRCICILPGHLQRAILYSCQQVTIKYSLKFERNPFLTPCGHPAVLSAQKHCLFLPRAPSLLKSASVIPSTSAACSCLLWSTIMLS